MSCMRIYGADCKLGYSCDPDLGYILPFDCEPINVKRTRINEWHYDRFLFNFNVPILNQNYLNLLENEWIIDGKKDDYKNFSVWKENESEECDGCEDYSPYLSDYVSKRTLGFHLNITYKISHSYNIKEILMGILDGRSDLSKKQEDLECYVLINGKEGHEWSLKELVEFCRDNGDDEKYQCTLRVETKNIGGISRMNHSELDTLVEFLKYLYLCYRKIEIIYHQEFCIYEDSGFKLPKKDLKIEIHNAICIYKKRDRDALMLYGIAMKKLFKSYKSYLEYCALHRKNIDTVGTVIEDVGKLKTLLDDLNSSSRTVFTSKFMKKYKSDLMGMSKNALTILDGLGEGDLQNFLVLLYLCYKKMERKLMNTEHLSIYVSTMTQYNCVKSVILELQEAMDEYRSKSSKSIIERYPTMEDLFWCYLRYINLCKNNDSTIDEEIPGTVDELNLLYEKLDSWEVKKACDTWYGSDEKVVFSKESYLNLPREIQQMHESGKFRVIINEAMNRDQEFSVVYPDEIKKSSGISKQKKAESKIKAKALGLECHHKTGNQEDLVCSDCGGLIRSTICCQRRESIFEKLNLVCSSKRHREFREEEEKLNIYKKMNRDYAIKELSKNLGMAKMALKMYSNSISNLPRILKETDEDISSDSSDESSMEVDDGLDEGEVV